MIDKDSSRISARFKREGRLRSVRRISCIMGLDTQLLVGHGSFFLALIDAHVAWCGGEEVFLLGFLLFDATETGRSTKGS